MDPTAANPTGEARDEVVDAAEKRGLAAPRRTDDEAELAFLDAEAGTVEAETFVGRVPDGDVVEADHGLRPPVLTVVGSQAGTTPTARARVSRGVSVGHMMGLVLG